MLRHLFRLLLVLSFLSVPLLGEDIQNNEVVQSLSFYLEYRNIGFTGDRLPSDTNYSTSLFLSADIGYDILFTKSVKLKNFLSFDQIMGNYMATLFIFNRNYFAIGFGPMVGFFNKSVFRFNPGVCTYLRLGKSKGLGITMQHRFILYSGLDISKYTQGYSDIIISLGGKPASMFFRYHEKSYYAKDDGYNVYDDYTLYSLFFKSNIGAIPVVSKFELGYEFYDKSFIYSDYTTIHGISGAFAGIGFNYAWTETMITGVLFKYYFLLGANQDLKKGKMNSTSAMVVGLSLEITHF